MLLAVVVVGFAGLLIPETSAQAAICTPEAKGESVVKDTVDKINCIGFPNDHCFLCRIAWFESQYGSESNTYEQKGGKDYHGGIWQVRVNFTIDR